LGEFCPVAPTFAIRHPSCSDAFSGNRPGAEPMKLRLGRWQQLNERRHPQRLLYYKFVGGLETAEWHVH